MSCVGKVDKRAVEVASGFYGISLISQEAVDWAVEVARIALSRARG